MDSVKKATLLVLCVLALTGCGRQAIDQTNKQPVVIDNTEPVKVITVTASGFEPQVLTVTRGTTVTWKNEDIATHWMASDPYPTHTGLGGLNTQEGINQGESYQFTFEKIGIWPYHDHFRPLTYTGKVIVTE